MDLTYYMRRPAGRVRFYVLNLYDQGIGLFPWSLGQFSAIKEALSPLDLGFLACLDTEAEALAFIEAEEEAYYDDYINVQRALDTGLIDGYCGTEDNRDALIRMDRSIIGKQCQVIWL
jgi:hypothetical protein